MYCTKCGTENDNDSKFCTKCGTNIMSDIRDSDKKKIINPNLDNIKIKIKNRGILKTVAIVLTTILLITSVFFYANNRDDNTDNRDDNTDNNDNVGITILSTPPNADIYINEELVGISPETISLPIGSYSLKMDIDGYSEIRSSIDVTPDTERLEVNVTFEPIN